MQSAQTYVQISAAEEPLTVAELLLRYLELEGVGSIFGIPGVALSYLLDALKEQQDKFTYYICRHESGASYMADGYSRVRGILGVAIVSSGPGATNALTGAVTAHSCNSSVLVISGEVPQRAFGKGGFQEGVDAGLNISAIYRNADVYSAVITESSNFQTLFTRALRVSLSLPRSAAHVSLPQDIGGEILPTNIYFPKRPENYRAVPRNTDPKAAEQVIGILAEAENPLFFLGNGCRAALLPTSGMSAEARAATAERMRRFQHLLEKFAIPVVTSPNGKGIFPESHSLSLRNFGFGGGDWATVYIKGEESPVITSHCDAMVVLGSSLGQKTTNDWDPVLMPAGPMVQVDLNQRVIGRGYPIELGVVAELGAFIDDLILYGESARPNKNVVERRWTLLHRIKSDIPYAPPSFAPEVELVRCVGEILTRDVSPADGHVFIDATVCGLASLRYMTIDPPLQMHNAFPTEPMGWAPSAVVGAAIADPQSVCVSISGDGGFMMNGNEVSTAAQYKVGAVWVVLANNSLAVVERLLQQEFGGKGWNNLYQLGSPNLGTVARGLGADAVEVDSIEAFRDAFKGALARGKTKHTPQVVVASL
jgi:acetolactate synthase I/II/III large subunit